LSREEDLDAQKLQGIIANYLFTEKKPLRDDIIATMNHKPKLTERGKLADRITDRILKFVETFISGISGF